jgi:hypothetical protein
VSKLDPSVRYRPTQGFPGYIVGDDGSVWTLWIHYSKPRRLGLEPKRMRANGGYPRYPSVKLYGKGGFARREVHRLVLEAFDGPSPPSTECRHLDGDRSNCRLDNLMWGTHARNAADMKAIGNTTAGERNAMAKLTAAQVIAIRTMLSQGAGCAEVAELFGVHRRTISDIRSGKTWR